MHVIHKFPIKGVEKILPAGRVLSIQKQFADDDYPTVWVQRELVDGEVNEAPAQVVELIGTGHPFEEYVNDDLGYQRQYLSSVILFNGTFVLHAFVRDLTDADRADLVRAELSKATS